MRRKRGIGKALGAILAALALLGAATVFADDAKPAEPAPAAEKAPVAPAPTPTPTPTPAPNPTPTAPGAPQAIPTAPGALPPEAGGEQILEKAQQFYEYGDYPAMVGILAPALAESKFSPSELPVVHRLLGIGYFILQRRAEAQEQFLRLLLLDPTTELDPLYVPPIILDFFAKVRKDNHELLETIARERRGEGEAAKPPDLTPRTKNPYAVIFIPFGAGQFQNGEPVKGGLFLASELLTLAGNISGYFVSKGLKGDDGFYSPSDAKAARALRITQYVSLGAFAALWIGGIIDAALNYREYAEPAPASPAAPAAPDQP